VFRYGSVDANLNLTMSRGDLKKKAFSICPFGNPLLTQIIITPSHLTITMDYLQTVAGLPTGHVFTDSQAPKEEPTMKNCAAVYAGYAQPGTTNAKSHFHLGHLPPFSLAEMPQATLLFSRRTSEYAHMQNLRDDPQRILQAIGTTSMVSVSEGNETSVTDVVKEARNVRE
jgi:hypothetical protein